MAQNHVFHSSYLKIKSDLVAKTGLCDNQLHYTLTVENSFNNLLIVLQLIEKHFTK